MNVSFACPSCHASGRVDAVHIGRQVRCKRCGAHFVIEDPEGSEPDVYSLEQPTATTTTGTSKSPAQDAVFVPARADATAGIDRPRRPDRIMSMPTARVARTDKSDLPWRIWLIRGCIGLVIILTAIALLAPQGTWLAGIVLIAIGSVLVPVAYFAGAYGAFSEDSLYGLLYIMIPLYAGYYLVTRWEDLWIWMVCATVGVGLVLLGTEMIRWAGAVV
jgi:predicted Zn finger-like uncharacterized protein